MKSIKLKIHKREIEFNFGLAFNGELLESTGLSIDEVAERMQKNPFKMIPIIMYESAKQARARKGHDIEFSKDDFIEMLDESGGLNQKAVLTFISTFTDNLMKDVPEDEADGGPVKSDEPKKK